MTTLEELRKYFLVQKTMPTAQEFTKYNYHSAVPIVIEDNTYFVILRDNIESMLYSYLQKPNDYKVKEEMFGATLDHGYLYAGNPPRFIQLVLPKKWEIKEKNISRILDVVVTDIDQDNKSLLHKLYKRVRST
ncbi:MAG: hypothetical protein PHE21_00365 [Candidatus Dojkabacteria bacterium]|nr:hypothetical protein [Candidatus Dojkabacteria bacterium]